MRIFSYRPCHSLFSLSSSSGWHLWISCQPKMKHWWTCPSASCKLELHMWLTGLNGCSSSGSSGEAETRSLSQPRSRHSPTSCTNCISLFGARIPIPLRRLGSHIQGDRRVRLGRFFLIVFLCSHLWNLHPFGTISSYAFISYLRVRTFVFVCVNGASFLYACVGCSVDKLFDWPSRRLPW